MDVIFRGEEKNYTGFIMIDSFGSGTVFEKKKSSLAFKTRLLESNVISRIKSAHPIKMCRSDKLGIKEKNKSRKFPSTYFFVPCTDRSAP